jgi:hypothetical protein
MEPFPFMRKILAVSALPTAIFLVLLAGCSSSPEPKPVDKPAPEPVTGLHALAQMFTSARRWAPDVLILKETSLQVGKLKPVPGKAAAWQAIFVSPSLGQSRAYMYSVVDVGTSVREGIFPESPVPFHASTQSAQAFSIQAAKKDTDEVYETALTKAKDYGAKNPNLPINFLLELNNRSPAPAWRVIWGDSASHSGFSVLIDSATGNFIEVLH